eukprot:899625-Rhodomonas_salina.2
MWSGRHAGDDDRRAAQRHLAQGPYCRPSLDPRPSRPATCSILDPESWTLPTFYRGPCILDPAGPRLQTLWTMDHSPCRPYLETPLKQQPRRRCSSDAPRTTCIGYMVLPTVMRGTGIAYSATGRRASSAVRGTGIAYGATVRGTEIAYGAPVDFSFNAQSPWNNPEL